MIHPFSEISDHGRLYFVFILQIIHNAPEFLKLFVGYGVNILCEENDKNRQREVLNTNHIALQPRQQSQCYKDMSVDTNAFQMMREHQVSIRIYLSTYNQFFKFIQLVQNLMHQSIQILMVQMISNI